MRSTLTTLASTVAFCAASSLALADDIVTFNPPVHKHGIGCTAPEDVHKFVDFIKDLPGDMPGQIAIMMAEGKGIRCSGGEADIASEQVVEHFTWFDGSPMLMIHYMFVGGGDVYTWRQDKPIEPSAAQCDTNQRNCI